MESSRVGSYMIDEMSEEERTRTTVVCIGITLILLVGMVFAS
jgi:hypothetical protein